MEALKDLKELKDGNTAPLAKVPKYARSSLWQYFEKGTNADGKEVVKCIYCGKEYIGRGITTSVR